jgi:hypothetical protein
MIKDSTTRVQKYLDRLATAKGYHKECIHTFLTGDGEEISLLASDLKELVQFARDAQHVPLSDVVIRDLYSEEVHWDMVGPYVIAFARSIEAAHGITQEKHQ